MTSKSFSRVRGFTLIELMVTAAIVAVLAAIAVLSYASYIARARRADARVQLVQAAQFMQRFYTANDSFSKDHAGNDVINQVPASLLQAREGQNAQSRKLSKLSGKSLISARIKAMAACRSSRLAPVTRTLPS